MRGNPPQSFRLTARVLLYAPSHRQDSTYHSLCYTSHGALAGTRNSSMCSCHESPFINYLYNQRVYFNIYSQQYFTSINIIFIYLMMHSAYFMGVRNSFHEKKHSGSVMRPIKNQMIYYLNRKEKLFYSTTHSTHLIYSYMASDIW